MKSLPRFWRAGIQACALVVVAPVALAAPAQQALLSEWQTGSTRAFSATRGQKLFNDRTGSDWSCATCHTADPRQAGQHATTSKPIKPLAPAANAARFTDPAKVEKWFRRNCNDVLGRECTPTEKGDVLTWLMSLK
mgnify:CR=1 FL=1|jgi:mono/diheme cytochrome c family protein